MPYSTPFVTAEYIAYRGDRTEHTLSLAIHLVDDFTGRAPLGRFRVFLKERRSEMLRGQEPVRNLSGYYCFLDLAPGTYTIVLDPDPASRFYDLKPEPGDPWPSALEREVELPLADPVTGEILRLDPSLLLSLAPGSGYPFPAFTTLVRGRVTKGNAEAPAPFAVVRSEYTRADAPADLDNFVDAATEARADRDGFYALVFQNPLPTDQSVDITASFQGAEQTADNQPIHEGSTTAPVDITVP